MVEDICRSTILRKNSDFFNIAEHRIKVLSGTRHVSYPTACGMNFEISGVGQRQVCRRWTLEPWNVNVVDSEPDWILDPEVLQHVRRVDSHIVSMFLLADS